MAAIDIIFTGLLLLILIPVALIDLQQRRIPNKLNLGVGLLGFAHAMIADPTWGRVATTAMTIVVAFVAFAGTSWVIQRINRNAKIGWGDLKFLIAASVWVGVDGSVAILFVASVISVLATALRASRSGVDWRQPQPFGPMLTVGMLTVVAAGFFVTP